jgi:hypothetical protein
MAIYTDKVLFIHVPKTCGISLTKVLEEKGLDSWNRQTTFFFHHDPLFLMQENNVIDKDCFVFSIVRNPFTRAYSLYKHFIKIIKGYNIQGDDNLPSFEFFLNAIKTKQNIFFTPIANTTQSYYLKNKDGNISLSKIYRFENLNELENDFKITLPRINVGNYTKDDYKNACTENAISMIQEIYHEDFINFNYSFDSF